MEGLCHSEGVGSFKMVHWLLPSYEVEAESVRRARDMYS